MGEARVCISEERSNEDVRLRKVGRARSFRLDGRGDCFYVANLGFAFRRRTRRDRFGPAVHLTSSGSKCDRFDPVRHLSDGLLLRRRRMLLRPSRDQGVWAAEVCGAKSLMDHVAAHLAKAAQASSSRSRNAGTSPQAEHRIQASTIRIACSRLARPKAGHRGRPNGSARYDKPCVRLTRAALSGSCRLSRTRPR